MAEEREKRDRRPHAQRLKRVQAEEMDQAQISLESIRQRVSGLGEKHVQLREMLSKRKKTEGEKLQHEFDAARANGPGSPLPESSWNDALLETVLEQANTESTSETESIYTGKLLYYIGRKSIFLLQNRQVGIQFTPTFSGEEQENYFCVLGVKPPSEKIVVINTNIPFFLPLRDLEKAHLHVSVTTFVDHVDNILQAYVDRRGQIAGLKEQCGEHIQDLFYTLPYNVVQFSLDDSSYKADVELYYDELESEYPTRISVQVYSLTHPFRRTMGRKGTRSYQTVQSASRRVGKAEELLRDRRFPEVYTDLVKEIQAACALEYCF